MQMTFLFFVIFKVFCDSETDIATLKCKDPPQGNYLDLSTNYEVSLKNMSLYACGYTSTKRIYAISCYLSIFSSTFKSIGPGTGNGGAIYLYYKDPKSIEGVGEIVDCTFIECKALNGGAMKIYIKFADRSINITNCTFINNRALGTGATGGAIHVEVFHSNIFNCTFIDNYCDEKGLDIYYTSSEGTPSNYIPLTIQYCRFERSAPEALKSLVYLYWKSSCDFVFNNNDITLPVSETSDRVYLFDMRIYTDGGTISTNSNVIFPTTSYVAIPKTDASDKINVSIGFIDSPNQPPPDVPEGCPLPPAKYEKLTDKYAPTTGVNLYGCKDYIERRIEVQQSLLYLYSCTFHKIVSDSNGGAIKLSINKDGAPEGSIVINNCTFSDCKGLQGGALSIETKESVRLLNVTESVFKNNEATSIGGAIYFHSTYATFDKCTFTNNIAATHGSDLYFYVYEEEDTEYPFLVENCKFTHDKEYAAEKTASLIYLSWRPQSDFYFNNNEIRIKENSNAFLFGSNEDVTTGNLSCKSNCLIPSNRYLCKEYPILYNKLKGGFSTSCDPNAPAGPSECPAPPEEDYFDLVYGMDSTLKNVTLYGCNIKTSEFVGGASCALLVYSSTFKSIGKIDANGGAIYIYIATAKTIERISQIKNCSFTECKSKSGGAIYIKITRSDRSANVENCTFTNNQAESTGGAIFFDIVYSDVKKCIFIDNNAKTSGNDIHYQTSERTASTSNPLSIQYCQFQRSSKENSLSLIYLYMKSVSDVEFSYNNITLPRSTVAERTYLFAVKSEGTGGSFKAESNFIAPKTSYVVDSSSALNNKIVNTSFFESPDQPPPEVPEGCPLPPKSYEDLSEGLERFDGINIYGCQLSIESRIDAEISLLYLYSCTFHNIVSNSKGGAIMLTINKDGAPEGSIVINNCTFSDNKGLEGGALFIETKESVRLLNVTESVFKNNEATSIGGAIYFHSTYATFDKCTFTNNIAATHGSDLYFYVYEEIDTEYPFLVENCKFKHDKEYAAEKTASLIYLSWRPQSDFYFNNNEIRIKENSNAFLFGSNEDVTTGNLSCKSNCLIPSNRYLCKEYPTLFNKLKGGFSTSCDPNIEAACPAAPTEDYYDILYGLVSGIENTVVYGCEARPDTQIKPTISSLYLYSCIFEDIITETDNGGAIYLSVKIASPTNENIIEKCQFRRNKGQSGGSIYLYNNQKNKNVQILNCVFEDNSASTNGGAIMLKVVFAKVLNCRFTNNYAGGNGQEIYYENAESPSGTSNSPDPFLVQGCVFEGNNTNITKPMIYLKWAKKADFHFINNSIIIERTKPRRCLFAASTELDATSGNLTSLDNIISPSTDFISESLVSDLYNRVIGGFITSPDAPLPPPPSENCPNPPRTYDDLSELTSAPTNRNLYGCELTFDKQVNSKGCLLFLYLCTFDKTDSLSAKGGAVYLSTNLEVTLEGGSVIYGCTFRGCKGGDGGSIYIQIQDSARFLNISKCTFENNEASGNGGSIFLYSTYCTIDGCVFNNNKAATKGNEIYFEIYENVDTEYPFIVENCKFTNSIESTAKSLIYLEWRPESDFYFNKNEIRITNTSNQVLFETNGNIMEGNLSCENNCFVPDNSKICSDNPTLLEKIQKGFSDYCEPQRPNIIKDDNDCTKENHCEKINEEEKYIHVNVTRSKFTEFTHEDNGGAVHIINTGLTIIQAEFYSCASEKAGGGGIYIYNDLGIPNTILLRKLQFNECRAVFGGAIYIYSSNKVTPAIIDSCDFIENSLNEQVASDLKGGSSIYLTTGGVSEIIHCKFKKNRGKGGGCKINRDLSEKPKNNNNVGSLRLLNRMNEISNSRILISDCSFEIDENSECSVFLKGSVNDMKTEIKDCTFTGNLGKNAHHIDGQSVSKKKSNLQVSSCKFSSDKSGAVNSQFLEIDTTKQVFNVMTEKVKKNSSFNLRVLAVAAEVFCIVAAVAFIVKKRNEARMQAYDITLMTDENEKSN